MSVAVAPSGNTPVNSNPTTSGINMYSGWPSMFASASMPPTPHPNTPTPLIMVVWLSVPTNVSGRATGPPGVSWIATTRARYSRLTW